MADYTVIIYDYSDTASARGLRVATVQVQADAVEAAAGVAEVVIATEVWNKRHPGIGEPHDQEPRMDDEWIACMEAVGTKAVIEGHPRVYIEDDIYNATPLDDLPRLR
jgi:hypothetical protein